MSEPAPDPASAGGLTHAQTRRGTPVMRHWIDPHGDEWPITGHRCSVCQLPMTRVTRTQTTHPGCDPGAPE